MTSVETPFEVEGLNIGGPLIQQPNTGNNNETYFLQYGDIFTDAIISGLVTNTSSTLTGSISSGVAYVGGQRTVCNTTTYSAPASSTSYIQLDEFGNITLNTTSSASSGILQLYSISTSTTEITGVQLLVPAQPTISDATEPSAPLSSRQLTSGELSPVFAGLQLNGTLTTQPGVNQTDGVTLSQVNDLITSATAPTVDIGTITTGSPGSAPVVTNSGTPSALVLDFTIPQGSNGTPGQPGAQGTPGGIASNSIIGQPILIGQQESQVTTSASTSAVLNYAEGLTQCILLSGDITLTFSPSGGRSLAYAMNMTLLLQQDSTGNRVVTWPANTIFCQGVPTLSTTPSATDIFKASLLSGANGWLVSTLSQNISGVDINTSPSYVQLILSDTPVCFWPLNETSGEIAHDLSGNGNNGTYTGGITFSEPGIPSGGTSVLLNGSTGYVYSASTSLIDKTPFTWEVWIKTTYEGSFFGSGNTNPFTSNTTNWSNMIWLGTNGQISTHSYIGQSVNVYGDDTSSVANDGNWHHIVQTYDGEVFTIYQDGQNIGSTAITGTISGGDSVICVGNGPGTSAASLDYWPSGNYNYLEGNYANVAIYDYALTSAQIQNHYNAGIS